MRVNPTLGRYYLLVLLPPLLVIILLGLWPVKEVNLLLFGLSYLWPIVLSSKKLREKSQHQRQRYSFLRCVFFLHDLPLAHPLARDFFATHQYYDRILPFLGPCLFTLFLWLVTSSGNIVFVLLAMILYLSVQWIIRRYLPQALPVDF